MEEHIRAYANLRLKRAREELETARENIAHGHYRAAVSRAYYAVYYMASAALFSQSVQRVKHFDKHLVMPKALLTAWSSFYAR